MKEPHIPVEPGECPEVLNLLTLLCMHGVIFASQGWYTKQNNAHNVIDFSAHDINSPYISINGYFPYDVINVIS
jgi:hypothetical protein